MLYRVTHVTQYSYQTEVSVSHHLLHLRPRETARQRVECFDLIVQPEPAVISRRIDYFGNHAHGLTIEGGHRQLEVVAGSRIRILAAPRVDGGATPPWESVVEACRQDCWSAAVEAAEFRFDSPFVRRNRQVADYARTSFMAGRPMVGAVQELNARIFEDFQFDARATSVATPLEEVFEERRGVCQDFAHLMIACLRSLGLPARYVSGYLETVPPKGQARLVGADASHAWVSVWCPGVGWMDFDPTNNLEPAERHITVAWGRDFGDVSPIRGVLVGSGDHALSVSVDVEPLDDAGSEVVPRPMSAQSQSQMSW
jgi:transglutaminase-like putative cysteine protease